MQAFANYQSKNAWVWEHQALVRARVVAGYQPLAEEFNQVRQNVLCQQRNLADLQDSIIDMREKMRTHLEVNRTQNKGELFHLKQDTGGIVDIEFMVQYAVLAWSNQQPSLVEYTDNIRILERLNELDMLPAEQAETLAETYKSFRIIGHRLALQQQKAPVVEAKGYARQRNQVQTVWRRLLIDVDK
jgi:glutamate-ammonia-ligase adenylyltransferase